MATLQFLGATRTVTGSKYLLEADGGRALVDCGLFQGLKELRLRNWQPLPVNPSSINWVILTHAHIDHTGYLPRLVRDGFDGPIYATKATADLLGILLPDSARLQEEDADYANRKGFSKHHPALPLYTEDDARAALKLIHPIDFGQNVQISKAIQARFIPAGHILGSSFVKAEIARGASPGSGDAPPLSILFSGDIGRYDEPILNDPVGVDEADYLLVESTYGDRTHEHSDPKQRLAEIINATVQRGGKVIIPAFSVGRTQLLVYYIRQLEDEHRIPILPVAVDSPMSASVTRLYSRHEQQHDPDLRQAAGDSTALLSTRNFSLVQGKGGSKALDEAKGPAIIISAPGMATGGRILHHLARFLPDEPNTVVFVGYQAVGTRGRLLQSGSNEIKIYGNMVPVHARIESIGSLSAHADSSEILRWLSSFKRAPRETFIVHGEPDSAEALRKSIVEKLGWKVTVPAYKQVVELN